MDRGAPSVSVFWDGVRKVSTNIVTRQVACVNLLKFLQTRSLNVAVLTNAVLLFVGKVRTNNYGCALRSSDSKQKSTCFVSILTDHSNEAYSGKYFHTVHVYGPACSFASILLFERLFHVQVCAPRHCLAHGQHLHS